MPSGEAAGATREKFETLDAIRGIAALTIVVYHTTRMWGALPAHEYLAVDLFFILSGFVIAHAYEARLTNGSMSAAEFIVVRLVRLYPMYLLGLVLGVFARLQMHVANEGSADVLRSGAMAALFMPSQLGEGRSFFPLNGVYWSLMFEIVINFVYALTFRLWTRRVLLIVVTSAGMANIVIASIAGTLDLGWSWTWLSIAGGLARSVFGIPLGVLLYRERRALGDRLRLDGRTWAPLILVLLLLEFPILGAPMVDVAVDLGTQLAAAPIIVLLASRAPTSRFVAGFRLLGSASYPVYVIHKPLLALLVAWRGTDYSNRAPFAGMAFMVGVTGLGVLLERQVDVPFRRWLTRLSSGLFRRVARRDA